MEEQTASDEVLLQALPQRPDLLATLYERLSGPAFGLALRMLGDRESAEEVVQEAFLALWRHAARFDVQRGTVRTWLLSIVHRRAIDRLRGRAPVGELPAELGADPAPESDVGAQVLRRLEREQILEALAQLPAEQREAVELAYFAGLTHVQIAAALGVPLGTVKSRLRLALGRLRALLDEGEGGEG
jgi:RNA polymerase sigma-70 factor (ECF subfamily)